MNDELKAKVEKAITRLQMFQPPEGYYLAFSGGKDSVVIKRLAEMAGINYTAHYNVTSVDPPELVRFIREKHPDVSCDIPRDRAGKQIHMWNLIHRKGPPLKLKRFCCEALKETQGDGHVVVTGVRWAESVNRRQNQGAVTLYKRAKSKGAEALDLVKDNDDFRMTPKGGAVLVNDNDESRKIVEQCYQKGRVTVNPIVEWEDADVWDFINTERLPMCGLYEDGYTRIGCIGCPMASVPHRLYELSRYPKYKAAYKRAFAKWIERKKAKGTWVDIHGLSTVNDIYHWWLMDRPLGQTVLPGFDDDEEEEI